MVTDRWRFFWHRLTRNLMLHAVRPGCCIRCLAAPAETGNMLVTKQPTLRRFWYPVMSMKQLADGPKPFRLLDTNIVLWLTSDGTPAAIADRCCHRTAKLSRGYCDGDRIVCGYHGWQYDRSGVVVRIPQTTGTRDLRTAMRVPAYNAAERYG